MNGWIDVWVEVWMDGCTQSRFKDCLQQSKTLIDCPLLCLNVSGHCPHFTFRHCVGILLEVLKHRLVAISVAKPKTSHSHKHKRNFSFVANFCAEPSLSG